MATKRTELILKLAKQTVVEDKLPTKTFQNESMSKKEEWRVVPNPENDGALSVSSNSHTTSISEVIQYIPEGNEANNLTEICSTTQNNDLPSTSNGRISSTINKRHVFRIINSSDEDYNSFDDSDADPHYEPDKCTKSTHVFNFGRKKSQVSSQHKRDTHDSSSSSSNNGSIIDQNESLNIDFLEKEPEQRKRGRKRVSDKNNWVKNKTKLLKNSGQAYTSTSKSKREMPEKTMKPPCDDRCKLKCSQNIPHELRQVIFNNFWQLKDLSRQRDFIASHIQPIQPIYRYAKPDSNRKLNNAFYFQVENKRIRVCKLFFKNTLDITDRPIRTVIDKKVAGGGFVMEDLRGKHNKHKTLDVEIKEGIRRHIQSIPKIESHYLRENTTRDYIEGGKTIADLHRDYQNDCKLEQRPFGNYVMYHKIFTEEFNISMFTPKKDQCELCHAFNTAEGDDKKKIIEQYEKHIIEKDLSRLQKQADKEKVGDNVVVACYDLQAVLPCPKGEVSLMYYKSKLNVFNLTVCELKNDNATCFVWHEGEGNRGSSEIATCILKFIESKTTNVNEDVEFIFYSDNCGGQQKNKFVFAMYLYALEKYPVKSITHKFLIRGHSQNEGDSVHSMIEKQVKKALKSGPIYHPGHYVSLMKTAKKTGNPYKVVELSHSDFMNFKDLWDQIGINSTVTTNGNRIYMSDIKIVKVDKDSPLVLKYKTTFDENEEYEEVSIQDNAIEGEGIDEEETDAKPKAKRRRSTRKKEERVLKKISEVSLVPMYNNRPSISERKKKDLRELVEKNIIPNCYSYFYNSL